VRTSLSARVPLAFRCVKGGLEPGLLATTRSIRDHGERACVELESRVA
jgi:hypothetical protein